MIVEALDEFESQRLLPTVKTLKESIVTNDEKTDELVSQVDRLYGAIWGVGGLFALPGLIWICMQIYYKATH
jgi:hypothetical protein